jgi:hypothetical protein
MNTKTIELPNNDNEESKSKREAMLSITLEYALAGWR